ncbi:hypothetical protein [Verrucomicrobium spinosum]|uniref:hypothetical protein n=1 Tax=Verrucomicrobium spinosum TaxID=2736 RepID=UPI0012E0E26D|nr:hypothetical protein [Verrucomicrobium spinosum]
MGLKLVHELWHGIATQKYGGVVPEWGVQIIAWISPMTYVDASSSWRFPNRWHRIKVAAAGMYVELLLAVAALHLWTVTEPGLLREICFNVLISASMITLLFNANPLMRFDGYYIFSDLLDLRNLGQRGQQAFTWLNRRLFLGAKHASLPPVVRKRFFTYLTYGVASWCWRILVTIGLMALAAHLFHGMGLLPLLIAGVLGVAGFLHSAVSFFKPSEKAGHIPWGTAWWRIGLGLLVVVAALLFIQINPSAAGLAVVEYPGKAVVRAEVPGFMARQYVKDGQRVEKGQQLIDLANEPEVVQLEMYHAQLGLSETKARMLYLTGRFEEWQTEQQKTAGLKEKVAVQQKRVRAMEVRSPISGRVHAPGLPQQRAHSLTPAILCSRSSPMRPLSFSSRCVSRTFNASARNWRLPPGPSASGCWAGPVNITRSSAGRRRRPPWRCPARCWHHLRTGRSRCAASASERPPPTSRGLPGGLTGPSLSPTTTPSSPKPSGRTWSCCNPDSPCTPPPRRRQT